MTAGVTAFLYLMAIFYDVSAPPCTLHTNACTLLTKVIEVIFFLLRLSHFFVEDYRIIVCFRTIFSRKLNFTQEVILNKYLSFRGL
jgi:hypothetical protein